MKIDTTTGKASAVRVLSEPGFESLAITAPGGCASGSDSSGSYTNVPTLNVHGLAVAALLLLLTGLFATRRL